MSTSCNRCLTCPSAHLNTWHSLNTDYRVQYFLIMTAFSVKLLWNNEYCEKCYLNKTETNLCCMWKNAALYVSLGGKNNIWECQSEDRKLLICHLHEIDLASDNDPINSCPTYFSFRRSCSDICQNRDEKESQSMFYTDFSQNCKWACCFYFWT